MHRGRRAALKTPSDACAEDCRGKLIWPRCPINACSPWCVPIITLRESVLTTKSRQRFSAVTCCTSNVNPPAGFHRHDGKSRAYFFSDLLRQHTSRKFGLYPFSVSPWTESKASASRALRSTTADHSQENSPPGSRRSSLPKVFHQSSYHPWVCSVPDTTKLMTRCGVSEIRYICFRLA